MGSGAGRVVVAGARALALLLSLLCVLGVAPAIAQSPGPGSAGTLCLLSLAELNELTGLRFVSMAAGSANCSYDSDPAQDLYTIDLRIEGPDPTAVEPMEDGLFIVRFDYPDGSETTLSGYPAWESSDGVWVDIGEDVFVVQPILVFASDPPAARSFLVPVAELALNRYATSPAVSEVPG